MQSSNEGEGSRVAKKPNPGTPGFTGFFTNNELNAAQNPRQEVPAPSYQGSRVAKKLPPGTPGFRGVFTLENPPAYDFAQHRNVVPIADQQPAEDSPDTNDIVIQGSDCTITISRN